MNASKTMVVKIGSSTLVGRDRVLRRDLSIASAWI